MASSRMIESGVIEVGKVKPGKRAERDSGDLLPLIKSIQAHGLLHPIVIDHEDNLIAGWRRLRAFGDAGLKEIPYRRFDLSDVSDAGILEMIRDENECRKNFTPTERAAIADAIKKAIGNRQGKRTDQATGELPPNLAEVKPGQETRDAAARAAGFSSKTTYQNVEKVIANGTPELQEAMDEGLIKPGPAAEAASLPPEEQREVVEEVKTGRKSATKVVRDKKAKPKPVKASQPLYDAFHNEVPNRCRDAYADPWIQKTYDLLCVVSEQIRLAFIMDGMEKRKKHYPFFKHDDFKDCVGWVIRYLDEVIDHINKERPAGVCPKCKGVGCPTCRMSGMVPRQLYLDLTEGN